MRIAAAAAAALLAVPAGAATFFGATPYAGFSDSPFLAVPGMTLETFEDGAANVAGVGFSSATVLGPAQLTDSVDADDGAVDGSGTGGRSLYSSNQNTLSFVFDAGVLGALPTHVGVVWTDVGFVTSGTNGYGDVVLEAFDGSNVSLGTLTAPGLGDGVFGGQTAEDRFFGVRSLAGISRVTLTMPDSLDWEADHLQFSVTPVPEPSTYAMLAAGLLAVAAISRRRLAGRR